MKNENLDIITKHLANEPLNEAEAQLIRNEAEEVKRAEIILSKVDRYIHLSHFDTQAAWEKVNENTQEKPILKLVPWILKNRMRIAASLIVLLISAFAVHHLSHHYNQAQTQVLAAKAIESTTAVTLPDGTIVTLKKGSSLNYPASFSNNERYVKLNGEAFFEVTPNPHAPFIIETGKANVKVLGTTFNVKAYPNQSEVEVLVRTGTVELADAISKGRKVLLVKGESGVFNKETLEIRKQIGYDTNKLAWFTHEIEFDHTSLNVVFETLRNTYNVEFDLNGLKDPNELLTARYKEQNLEYILHVIELTHHLTIKPVNVNQYQVLNQP